MEELLKEELYKISSIGELLMKVSPEEKIEGITAHGLAKIMLDACDSILDYMTTKEKA